MIGRARYFGAILLCAIGFSGCADMSGGPIPVSAASDNRLASVQRAIEVDCLDLTPETADATTLRDRRNRLVSAYIFAADTSYYAYERNLLDSIRAGDTGAAIASLTLSTLAGLIAVQELSHGLNGANSIIAGTHTAIGRDYLLNQTVNVLITRMQASRAAQRALIVSRRSLAYADWDSCMALSDVLALEQAGTLNAALTAVAADAADANRVGAQQERAAIQRVTQARDPLSVALESYLAPSDAALRRTRRETARTMIEEEGLLPTPPMILPERLSRIINDDDRGRERLVLARRLVANDAAGTTALAAAATGANSATVAADTNRPVVQQAPAAIERATQASDPLALALQAYLAPSDAAVRRVRRDAARMMVEEEGLLSTPPMLLPERLSRILNDNLRSREREVLARRLIASDAEGTAAVAAALPK